MLKQHSTFANHPIDIGLQFIRPQLFGGCDTLIVRDETILSTVADLHKTLENGILIPLKQDSPFEARGSNTVCRHCDYQNICEKGLQAASFSNDEANEAANESENGE